MHLKDKKQQVPAKRPSPTQTPPFPCLEEIFFSVMQLDLHGIVSSFYCMLWRRLEGQVLKSVGPTSRYWQNDEDVENLCDVCWKSVFGIYST